MKELVFPKDQEMFQGIDENGMLIPFDGTDTMASSYEINIDFYRNQHDTMKGTGSSEEEAERDIWKQMQIHIVGPVDRAGTGGGKCIPKTHRTFP